MSAAYWWRGLLLKFVLPVNTAVQRRMKRTRNEEFNEDVHQKASKRAKIGESLSKNMDADLTLPKDVWLEVLKYLHMYDIIFLRAVNSAFYQWCKEFRPFPKYFVLDQDKCMEYLVENGFISLLDYVKDTLRFEWQDELALVATRSGQVDTLKHLFDNGLPRNDDKFLYILECTRGTCSLSMLRFLIERGLGLWDKSPNYANYKHGEMTVMEFMAYHGHLDCIKYAMENGCTQQHIQYTPSIECLDFAINNGFEWRQQRMSTDRTAITVSSIDRNICEMAACIGDLTILTYAHQKGAPLLKSAAFASERGHLECLKYAMENADDFDIFPTKVKTLPCFKYLESKFGQRFKNALSGFNQIMFSDVDVLLYMLEIGIPKPDHAYNRDIVRLCHTDNNFKFVLDGWKMLDKHQPLAYIPLFDKNLIKSVKLVIERNLLQIQDFEIERYISGAISSKNVEMLELLWKILPRTNDVIKENHTLQALGESTPEILDFLTKQGIKWKSQHLESAAQSASLTSMAYLMKQGCKWEDTICSSSSHVCIKYAKEHGCTKTVKLAENKYRGVEWK